MTNRAKFLAVMNDYLATLEESGSPTDVSAIIAQLAQHDSRITTVEDAITAIKDALDDIGGGDGGPGDDDPDNEPPDDDDDQPPPSDTFDLQAAIDSAADGGTIRIPANTVFNSGRQYLVKGKSLTIECDGTGVNRAIFMKRRVSKGAIVFNTPGGRITLRNLIFQDITSPDRNGAGLRCSAGGYTVEHCDFIRCQDGILARGMPDRQPLIHRIGS
jgi:hypothetical protein